MNRGFNDFIDLRRKQSPLHFLRRISETVTGSAAHRAAGVAGSGVWNVRVDGRGVGKRITLQSYIKQGGNIHDPAAK